MSKPGTVMAVALLGAVAWVLRDVFLLVFASLLLAIFLRTVASLLQQRVKLPNSIALAIVLIIIVGVVALVGAWQGPRIAEEIDELRRNLPIAVDELRARIAQSETAQQAVDELPTPRELVGEGEEIIDRAQAFAMTATGALTAFGLWIFLAVLLAATPRTYVQGIVALVPRPYESRVEGAIEALRTTLWWWLLGRLLTMTFVGVATSVGLTLLGVPLAFVLGLIAALLTFVPNIGPLVSAIPAVLLAFADDPINAVWVAALYVAVQLVEGLVLDPIVDRKTVYLAPALTVTMQLVLGTIAGLAGVALAAPLTAAGMVLTSTFWIEGKLGKKERSYRKPADQGASRSAADR